MPSTQKRTNSEIFREKKIGQTGVFGTQSAVRESEPDAPDAAVLIMNQIAKLFSDRSLVRNALEFSSDAAVVADLSGTILYANQNVQHWFGYRRSEITGQTLDGLLPEFGSRDGHAHSVYTLSHVDHGQAFVGPQRVVCKDGTEVTAVLTLVSVEEQSEELIFAHFSKSDGSALNGQMLESERLDAIAKMISGIAHESRNALQRAVACLDLLELDLNQNHRQMELSGKIRRSLSDLLENYDEVRRFAEPVVLQPCDTDLTPVCIEAFSELDELYDSSSNELHIADQDRKNRMAYVDAAKLKEVFRHVMENAFDQRQESMNIYVSFEPARLHNEDAVRVIVRNDGTPFSDPDLASAFEPFYTTKQRGTGLGLSISLRIIEAHRGTIRATNPRLGGGAIEFTIPKNPPPTV